LPSPFELLILENKRRRKLGVTSNPKGVLVQYPNEQENEQHERLQLIAEALDLPESEIDIAMASESGLFEFADRYGQNLDYIVRGDLMPMLRILFNRSTAGRRAA
jgi:hypothetical protein